MKFDLPPSYPEDAFPPSWSSLDPGSGVATPPETLHLNVPPLANLPDPRLGIGSVHAR